MKIVLFTLPFLMLILFSCKKEQPQLNNEEKNPCDCASEVSADFVMEEIAAWNSVDAFYTETDSILRERHVRFKPKLDNAEYTWYLGTETETTQEVVREFPSNLTGTNQPIILVVEKEPNTLCFPNDDGYDSIVKYISITEYPIVNANDIIYGTKEGLFKVSEGSNSDSINITVDFTRNSLNSSIVNIYNYDGSGANCIGEADNYRVTYRETRISGDVTNCNRLRGYIKTPSIGDVEMFFTEFEPGHPDYQTYHYFGRRVSSP